jgi:hypothetical protein
MPVLKQALSEAILAGNGCRFYSSGFSDERTELFLARGAGGSA